jgi:GGDEF domain-containing protein
MIALRGPELRTVGVLRAGGVVDDRNAEAGEVLLSALQDARDELARRIALARAGQTPLMVFVPGIGIIAAVAGAFVFDTDIDDAFFVAETLLAEVDDTISGTGARLVARIRAGEADKLEDLRDLVARLTASIEQEIADVSLFDSPAFRFLRDVVARSLVDLGGFVRELPSKLPGAGLGIGAAAAGIALLILVAR